MFFQDMLARKAQRAPSVRLRFGRSDPSLRDNEVNICKFNIKKNTTKVFTYEDVSYLHLLFSVFSAKT